MATRVAKRAEVLERRAQSLKMCLEGYTFEEIAQTVGYKNASSARGAVNAVMRQRAEELRQTADEMRDKELMILLDLRNEAYEILHKFHVHVTPKGDVVRYLNDDGERETVEDDAPKLAAIGTLLRINERISKLFKLEAPTEIDGRITVNYTFGGVDMSAL